MPMPLTFADIAPRDPTQEMIDRAFPMLAARDKTAVKAEQKQALGSVMPKRAKSLSFPLNEMVGDCAGSRLSPEALAAGVIDAALWTGKIPYSVPLKGVTTALNTIPRYPFVYGDDFWKDACEKGRKEIDIQKQNLNAKENELINLFKPPIPYIDY